MRSAAPRALWLAAGAIVIGAVTPARAACTYNSVAPPSGVFALSGDVCAAAPGAYIPTVEPDVTLPVGYTGFGFFASNENVDGVAGGPGVIDAAGATTILTNTESAYANAYGAWSLGVGAEINFGGETTIGTAGAFSAGLYASGGAINATAPVTITTIGPDSPGVRADSGGRVTLNGGTVATTADGSQGLLASGAGSTIQASGVGVTTSGATDTDTGSRAYAVLAYEGGAVTMTGGSAATSGDSSYVAGVVAGGSLTLAGTTLSATGPGSGGLFINGEGGVINATGVSITTSGDVSEATGFAAAGAYNGSYPGYPEGGSLTLTNSTIRTTGDSAIGVDTEDHGSTSISGGSITTTNVDADAIYAASDASVTLKETALSTSGDGAIGVNVRGGGALTATGVSITTSGASANGILAANGGSAAVTGGSIGTAGNASYAVTASSGGLVRLNGTTIGTTGDGSGGLGINGAGSEIDATGVAIATKGGYDAVSGQHSYGVYNGPYGTLASGGVARLVDSTILTQGADMFGVNTSTGGATSISGGSVTTTGPGAYAVVVGGGGTTAISGTLVRATGNGGGGLSVDGGSTLTATGVTVATEGGYDPASGRHAYGLFNGPSGTVTSGGAANLMNSTISTLGGGSHGVVTGPGGITTLSGVNVSVAGAGAYGLLAYGGGATTAGGGAAGTINATGPLNIQTKNASSAAVALSGDGATIAATGGGTIAAAGRAIAFLGGTGQSATFDNFKIDALAGDLAFADASFATLNFNAVTADAGAGNLLNATAGSAITLNANASMLTGAIKTDAASTTNVNLTNGTTWNLTASSAVTNLSLAHSIVVFASPGAGGAFKTLTVTDYVGNGANIAMNVALGGSASAGDRIIVSGGKATGSTLLTINNAGGPGGQTSGAGIPIVMATDGGAIAANAFSLANMPIAGGYRYTLAESGGAWYLVSSPTATIAGLTSSIDNVVRAQQSQMITNRVLGSLLLGATQQISCSSCGGGFASIGSFALGGSGRWRLSDNLTVLGGLSYNQWSASGITVYDAPTVAGALLYDFVNWGKSRPFLEIGAGLTPYEQVNTSRVYANGLTTGYGYASAIDRQASVFGRAGWVDRLTPIDEAAAYVDLGRSWMQTGGYSEQATAINPFPATVPNGLATLNTARFGAQYTHLFNGNIEANVGAAVAYGFGAGAGAPFSILEFGTLAPGAIGNSAWFEYGARLGYRVTDRVVVDAFVLGTAGGLAGNYVHGGFGVRVAF